MNTKLKLCAAVLAATLTTTASAGVVTEWSYQNQAGFTNWSGTTDTTTTGDDVIATGNSSVGAGENDLTVNSANIIDSNLDSVVNGDDLALATKLTWGTPAAGSGNPQSSLEIESPLTGNMATNDSDFAAGTGLIHENWVVIGDTLQGGLVFDALALTPSAWNDEGDSTAELEDPANNPYFAPQLGFVMAFSETPNSQSGTCDIGDGEANGQGNNINGCGDVFALTIPVGASGIVVGDNYLEFSVPFALKNAAGEDIAGWSDTQYMVTTRLSGLSVLSSEVSVCGPQDEFLCVGFVTIEQTTNELVAGFKISTVPEPTAIALFGLGLIATGFAGRRRRSL
ncbi:MAG: hypothetical protein ACJAS9_002340 [Polaribacter sp.]|jgi:hypothetical protein